MELIICPICYNQIAEEYNIENFASPFNQLDYTLYHCKNCDIQFWEPLKIIPEFYQNAVFDTYLSFHEGIRGMPPWQKIFFKYFGKEFSGRLLDIGCGDGVFLREVQKLGFEVWGLDFDEKSIKIAKENHGLQNVLAMHFDEFVDLAREQSLVFDFITFFEVFEHQDKPKEFLEKIKNLLKDDGYIAGSVPNRDFLDMIKVHPITDYPPHHFLRFSKASIQNALKIVGLDDIEIHTTDIAFDRLCYYLLIKNFRSAEKLKAGISRKTIGNKRLNLNIKKTIFSFLKRTLIILLSPFALFYLNKLKGNGNNIFFYARKRKQK